MQPPLIRLDDPTTVREYRYLLEELVEVLARNGYDVEGSIVRELLTHLASDADAFVKGVTGTGIWGGSGSVSDCNFRGFSKADSDQAGQDQRRLDQLLALLAKRLKKDGMVNPRIESWGKTLEAWAKKPA